VRVKQRPKAMVFGVLGQAFPHIEAVCLRDQPAV
jgi:hypothetical protein